MTPDRNIVRIAVIISRCIGLALATVSVGCQPESICFVARDESSDSISSLKVERRSLTPSSTPPTAWQSIGPDQISWDDAVTIHRPADGRAEELHFFAPGYSERYFQVQWRPLRVREGSVDAVGYGDGNRLFDATMRPVSGDFPTKPVQQMSRDWSAVLSKVTTQDGYVRWNLLQENSGGVRDRLVNYVDQVAQFSPQNRPDLFPNESWLSFHAERIAYWINAYNALSMYWVVQHGYTPTIPALRDGQFVVGTRRMSIDEIESVLRGESDPAYVCAISFCARSCPPLRREPYNGTQLQEQEREQSRSYLHDPRAVVRDGDTLKLNDWIFLHRDVFGSMVQQQWHDGGPTEAERTNAAMVALNGMAGEPFGLFKDYKRIGRLGFDWTLNRPPG